MFMFCIRKKYYLAFFKLEYTLLVNTDVWHGGIMDSLNKILKF